MRPGDVVLDLGSGTGKVCYLAAQIVGPKGRVIGIDMNDDMLALARKYQAEMAAGAGTPCLDVGQAVIYRGPYASVCDDEGHVYARGARIAVCERSFRLLTEGPYRDDFIGITPLTPRDPVPWCAPAGTRRPAADTKGALVTSADGTGGCGTRGCC